MGKIQTRYLVFLDTCFVTHQGGYPRQPEVYEALGELCGGTDVKDVVFALTETVLYEMMQHDTGEIYEQSEQFLRGLKESGFTIVLIKEENVLHMVMPYVQRNAAEWNDFIVELKEHKTTRDSLAEGEHRNLTLVGRVSKRI